ncbi:hypothetical protein [Thalassotalea sp. PS06]|uniref:hypothetical protein n=1 Tax=Thalassotalea sp. PS06 TaxID=2594005 RepID=UPI001163DF5B|nr:hypothetical protein [Thalassotalea sp. PS06]QDP01544.1 hypothetical protein FNC98_09475 [Thalassotalea sp. PS06]
MNRLIPKPFSTTINLLITFVLLLLPPLSHAELIEADAFEAGDNKAFTLSFPRYKLIWMDASELLNLDRNELQALLDGGLTAQGWRMPTLSETKRIFAFMYTNRYETDTSREFPFVCIPEVSCTFVYSDSKNGAVWPTFQSRIGLLDVNDEPFAHTFFISRRNLEYLAFDLSLNNFDPGYDNPEYPEWQYDDFYYHLFAYTAPVFISEDYYAEEIDDYSIPFSFMLVKDVQRTRNNDTPIPEPASVALLLIASICCFGQRKFR